jgi:hypothetical protein
MRIKFVLVFIVLLITSCSEDNEKPYIKYISFGQAQKVDIIDYDDHIMEPFLSKNGMILFFNNLNHPSVNTNLHFATKINDSVFQYNGELKGVNTEFLEGVPTMTNSNILYLILKLVKKVIPFILPMDYMTLMVVHMNQIWYSLKKLIIHFKEQII